MSHIKVIGMALGLCLTFGEAYGQQTAPRQENSTDNSRTVSGSTTSETSGSKGGSSIAKVPQNTTIDYQGIANVFFQPEPQAKTADAAQASDKGSEYEDIVFTLTEPVSKSVLGMGHTIDLKVRNGANLKWNFDKEFKSLEYLSERTEDDFLHVVFKAKAPGEETVYFDCLDMSDPLNVKVLETKLIVIKVE